MLNKYEPSISLMDRSAAGCSFIQSLGCAPTTPGARDCRGLWTQVVREGNLSPIDDRLANVRLWMEGQSRFSDVNQTHNLRWYQGLLRTALGYSITDRLTIWAGYTYLPTGNSN